MRELYHGLFLMKAARLERLFLQGLPPGEFAALCRSLPHFIALQWLNLGGSAGVLPNGEAAGLLAAALRCLPRFARLWLHGCRVAAAAVRALVLHVQQTRMEGRGWTIVLDNAGSALQAELEEQGVGYDTKREEEGGFDFW